MWEEWFGLVNGGHRSGAWLQWSFYERSIQLKSLPVAEARRNHPISQYSAKQIATFQPRDTKLAVRSELLSTLTKAEMATKLQ